MRRAGLDGPGKAEVKVLPEYMKNPMAMKPLEGDNVAGWKQSWLGTLGLGFSPVCPFCRASLHSVQQHNRM